MHVHIQIIVIYSHVIVISVVSVAVLTLLFSKLLNSLSSESLFERRSFFLKKKPEKNDIVGFHVGFPTSNTKYPLSVITVYRSAVRTLGYSHVSSAHVVPS